MGRIEEKVVAAVNDDLMEYIVEDTRDLIHTFEVKILQKEYDVFLKFDKLLERVQNVIELSFRYVNNPDNTIPCDVAWLLVDLAELKCTINKCDYEFEEVDDFFEEPKIVGDLGSFISDTASGYFVERDYYFTLDDIEAYKNKIAAEDESRKRHLQKNEEERQKYIKEKKDVIDKWRKENLNKDFDVSVLSEEEINILKVALEMELKSISISWVQRRFAMGYCKAGRIIDHLEECGAISTYEEVEALGLAKSGRIIKISL